VSEPGRDSVHTGYPGSGRRASVAFLGPHLWRGNRSTASLSSRPIRRGIHNIGGSGFLSAHRETESLQLAKITHAAFVELAILLENVRLPDCGTGSHGPSNGHGQGLVPVPVRIEALPAFSFNAVQVRAVLESKERMSGQD